MEHDRHSFLKKPGLFCLVLSLVLGAPALAEQTTAKVQAQEATQAKSATDKLRMAVPLDKSAQLRAAIQRCGMPCKVGGSGSIAAPGDGGTRDYDCNENGDCHCFGAQDCVAMTDVCKEGTMGCNDQGCICEQDTGGG